MANPSNFTLPSNFPHVWTWDMMVKIDTLAAEKLGLSTERGNRDPWRPILRTSKEILRNGEIKPGDAIKPDIVVHCFTPLLSQIIPYATMQSLKDKWASCVHRFDKSPNRVNLEKILQNSLGNAKKIRRVMCFEFGSMSPRDDPDDGPFVRHIAALRIAQEIGKNAAQGNPKIDIIFQDWGYTPQDMDFMDKGIYQDRVNVGNIYLSKTLYELQGIKSTEDYLIVLFAPGPWALTPLREIWEGLTAETGRPAGVICMHRRYARPEPDRDITSNRIDDWLREYDERVPWTVDDTYLGDTVIHLKNNTRNLDPNSPTPVAREIHGERRDKPLNLMA
jgi:hypothetical protein